MAELAATTAIREALAVRLREISVAGGYRTDAGADVRTEPGRPNADDLVVTVHPAIKVRPDGARSRGEREFTVVVEATVPVNLVDAVALTEAVEADVEQALDEWMPLPLALPVTFEESMFLDRPDGLPVMAVQLQFRTGYRR